MDQFLFPILSKSDRELAIVAGFRAPLVYCLLFTAVIAFWLVTNIALQTIAPFYWHEQFVTRYLEDKLFDLIIYLIS